MLGRQALLLESKLLASFNEASLDEERFLKQKAKVHWLAEGMLILRKAVPKAFVDHYVGFLGKEDLSIIPITQELFNARIDQAVAVHMIREVTVDEIKRTMFAFGDDKAPGPDGFTAAFYKKSWDIVGKDVCLAVHDFFREGKLLMHRYHLDSGPPSILNIMPFVEGKLLVRYLGVPLVASRVRTSDCRALIEKVDNRVGDWKNKLLSFAVLLLLVFFVHIHGACPMFELVWYSAMLLILKVDVNI
ncbi:hypothetical protein QVD17_39883 [Tagetes erecta]|uniref:Uncharacterized protein n=1 Tax=Tagetes erecta TaxID=13708 RepID=A0AAD8JPC4_TARER|nr:hypothetical protein QVD17_39883 [Tagetes erecta]